MIELENVTKVFNRNRPNEFTAIREITLSLEQRRVTVFKGPSGSGKTTLLSIIGCMSRPTTGRIRLDGREITSLPERFTAQIRRDTFGFVFQNYNLIKGLTALENVMIPAYPGGGKYSESAIAVPIFHPRSTATITAACSARSFTRCTVRGDAFTMIPRPRARRRADAR